MLGPHTAILPQMAQTFKFFSSLKLTPPHIKVDVRLAGELTFQFLWRQFPQSSLAQFPGSRGTGLLSLLQLSLGLTPTVVGVGHQDNHLLVAKRNTRHLSGTEEKNTAKIVQLKFFFGKNVHKHMLKNCSIKFRERVLL